MGIQTKHFLLVVDKKLYLWALMAQKTGQSNNKRKIPQRQLDAAVFKNNPTRDNLKNNLIFY
jgi:hypothetical protein